MFRASAFLVRVFGFAEMLRTWVGESPVRVPTEEVFNASCLRPTFCGPVYFPSLLSACCTNEQKPDNKDILTLVNLLSCFSLLSLQ